MEFHCNLKFMAPYVRYGLAISASTGDNRGLSKMQYTICDTAEETGRRAVLHGSGHIRPALSDKREAIIILAAGTSQIGVLDCLVESRGIDWEKVTGFYLDEYTALSMEHPACFRRFLKERFVDRVPLRSFHYINREGERLGGLIENREIDAAFVGIGENGHLAFNDPPADFETSSPYLVTDLDERCRNQQVGEGRLSSLKEVSSRAISMSVFQVMQSRNIICTCPDKRNSPAVKGCVEGPVTPHLPASILHRHPRASLFPDKVSASLLSSKIKEPAVN